MVIIFRKLGFSLIEIIVVIGIIAVLSSVILSTVSTVRNKAKMIKTSVELKQFDGGLRAYRESKKCWPLELGTSVNCPVLGVANPTIESMLVNNTFETAQYMKRAPSWLFDNVQVWQFDNDEDAEPANCATGTSEEGVNLIIPNTTFKIYTLFEKQIDETSDNAFDTTIAKHCGKIQFAGDESSDGILAYQISAAQ